MPDAERDAFKNLLLLCLPHHADIDDPLEGAVLYPPEKLHDWKAEAEGGNKIILDGLGVIEETMLMQALAVVFEPPLKRLEAIAEQLESTGRLNEQGLRDLQVIISALQNDSTGPSSSDVKRFADAVTDLNSGKTFHQAVAHFSGAVDRYVNAIRMQRGDR